ncbi:hypothetical protein F4777DRAFT_70822 [Nemania sp. FL0916]|nr:hypothetical protein F4777DRAFT_70822 [Nemania sp. FL0916]
MSGVFGTKVAIKIQMPYGLVAVTSHVFLAFGAHKCPNRDSSDASGFGYIVSGEVLELEGTKVPSSSKPISPLIECAKGITLENIDMGTSTYDTQAVRAERAHEAITRRLSSFVLVSELHRCALFTEIFIEMFSGWLQNDQRLCGRLCQLKSRPGPSGGAAPASLTR